MAYVYSEGVYGGGLYSSVESADSARIAAWGFSINGHEFMFLDLGSQGTLVYDFSTQQWADWAQEGSVGLGFKDGTSFDEFFLLGDSSTNQIYTFDTEELDDSSGSFTSIATGGVPMRRRQTARCFAVYVCGNRSDEDDRELTLFTSDDNGRSWSNQGTITPTGDNPEMSWRSLGLIHAPGRVFELHDTGALASLDGMDMSTGPHDDE